MGRRLWTRTGVRLLVAAFVVVLTIGWWTVENAVWCDGVYQRFQIPDDYNGSGCSRIIPAWHVIFPWNWDRTEEVCLGLCPPDVPLWTPEG
ncbi:MAG TPA: hypothetical protein VFM03_05450 [Candidatus Limnocylindria bacterium]|jgi:hypothetical protein|nr:hypothetical protein [Candidatus Limnocylindria bacterium]